MKTVILVVPEEQEDICVGYNSGLQKLALRRGASVVQDPFFEQDGEGILISITSITSFEAIGMKFKRVEIQCEKGGYYPEVHLARDIHCQRQ